MIRISLICLFLVFSFSALGILSEQKDTYVFLDEYQNVLASENTQNDNSEKDTPKVVYVILKNVDDEELLELKEYILIDNKSAYNELVQDLQMQGKLKVFKLTENYNKNFQQNDSSLVVGTLRGGEVPQRLIESSSDEVNDIDFSKIEVLFNNKEIKGLVDFSDGRLVEVDDLNLLGIPLASGTLGGGGTARY